MSSKNLTTGSIPAHVRDMALPASVGLFFQTMYNIVDSFYAGQISTTALAALGLSFPVYLLMLAASGGLSRGASALIANAIGEKDEAKQVAFIKQSLSMGILISGTLVLAGLFVAEPIFVFMGATGEYLEFAMQYMFPIFVGSVFFVVASLCNSILIASGDSKTFSRVLIVGFFLNLILDPWFLYGGFGLPAMGIAGIAWATVTIQACGCCYMLSVVLRRKLLALDSVWDLLPDLRVYSELAQQSAPASFNIMSVALGFFVINYCLKPYGEASIAAFGVATRIEQIGLMPTFGLYAAITALVGQNNGAGKFDRVLGTIRFCNKLGLALSVTTSLIIILSARPLVRLFTTDPEVVEIGAHYIHIMMLIQWSYVLTSTHLATLQAIKRPFYGFFESVLRKIALPIVLIFLFGLTKSLGVDAVWYGMALANVLMTFVTIFYTWQLLTKLTSKAAATVKV